MEVVLRCYSWSLCSHAPTANEADIFFFFAAGWISLRIRNIKECIKLFSARRWCLWISEELIEYDNMQHETSSYHRAENQIVSSFYCRLNLAGLIETSDHMTRRCFVRLRYWLKRSLVALHVTSWWNCLAFPLVTCINNTLSQFTPLAWIGLGRRPCLSAIWLLLLFGGIEMESGRRTRRPVWALICDATVKQQQVAEILWTLIQFFPPSLSV